MPTRDDSKNQHLFPAGTARSEAFQLPPPNIDAPDIPARNRIRHARDLSTQMATVRDDLTVTREEQQLAADEAIGIQVEFESFPDVSMAFESLSRENQGIELLNVRHVPGKTFATVFVP